MCFVNSFWTTYGFCSKLTTYSFLALFWQVLLTFANSRYPVSVMYIFRCFCLFCSMGILSQYCLNNVASEFFSNFSYKRKYCLYPSVFVWKCKKSTGTYFRIFGFKFLFIFREYSLLLVQLIRYAYSKSKLVIYLC
jgi:hypothetical protein